MMRRWIGVRSSAVVAASMCPLYPDELDASGARERAPPGPCWLIRLLAERLAVAVLLDLNGLDRRQLAVHYRVAAELAEVDITVLVDVVRARHAFLAFRGEELVDDGLPVIAVRTGAVHRVED